MLACCFSRLDGSLMTEKTFEMHIADLKKRIINQILEYEVNASEPSEEAFNAGLHRAIDAVKETVYEADNQ